MKKGFFIILFFVLIFLMIVHFLLLGTSQTLNLFLQIFGGFVATLFGVYISLHLTNTEDRKKEAAQKKKKMIETLKFLLSEIDFNNYIFELVIKVLSKDYQHSTFMTYDFEDIEPALAEIKDKAYYSVISSGDFKEISNDLNLLNSILDCYDSMRLTMAALKMTIHHFKSENTITEEEDIETFNFAQTEFKTFIKSVNSQIAMNKETMKIIRKILKVYGIEYRGEKRQKSKK